MHKTTENKKTSLKKQVGTPNKQVESESKSKIYVSIMESNMSQGKYSLFGNILDSRDVSDTRIEARTLTRNSSQDHSRFLEEAKPNIFEEFGTRLNLNKFSDQHSCGEFVQSHVQEITRRENEKSYDIHQTNKGGKIDQKHDFSDIRSRRIESRQTVLVGITPPKVIQEPKVRIEGFVVKPHSSISQPIIAQ